MVKKLCSKCGNFSYSAFFEGPWICPTCGKDLTSKKPLPLDRYDRGQRPRLTLVK